MGDAAKRYGNWQALRTPALLRAWQGKAEGALEAEREQLPLWIVVAFGAGIAAWFAYGNLALLPIVLAATALLLWGYGFGLDSRIGAALAICGVCLALGIADIALQADEADPKPLAKPYFGTITGEVIEVEHLPARQLVRWTIHPAQPAGLPTNIRLNVPASEMHDGVREGAIVQTKARLMPPAGPAVPGAYDFAQRAWFDGLGATGAALGKIEVLRSGASQGQLARWRTALARHIRTQMDGAAGALGATLATGDRGAIDEIDAEAMRRSGMAHLLSISGLHVSAVVGAIYLIVSRLLALIAPLALRISVPLVAAGAAAAGAIGYTLLTGAEVPTIRACVATLLVLVAMALGRQPISLRMIAAGALLVLAIWPQSLTGPSFQLSFAAVTAIVALHEWPPMKRFVARADRGRLSRAARFVIALFITGLVVEIVLMPIAMYHFHKAGLYGPFANVLAIPLTTFIVMPLEALALFLDTAGLGGPAWYLCEQALHLLLAIAQVTASQPGSVATLPSMAPSAFGLIIAGGLMLCLLKTQLRLVGVLPLVAGGLMALTTPMPDLLITGDGRHVAFADGKGGIALLRGSAGDYVRELLGENAGSAGQASAIAEARNARCSNDICLVQLRRGDRLWTIGATRSGYLVPSMELAAFCRRTDIMISDRRLPYSCRPSWLKIDRTSLASTGGLSIDLAKPAIHTVAERTAHLPWSTLRKSAEQTKRPKSLPAVPSLHH